MSGTKKIFISYRRCDADPVVSAQNESAPDILWNWLSTAYKEQVFLDRKEGLELAGKWPLQLKKAVSNAEVVIVVIGQQWIDELSKRELQDDTDWVLEEVSLALRFDKVIIPILVGNAQMPSRSAFPDKLRGLEEWQAYPFNVDAPKPCIDEIRNKIDHLDPRKLHSQLFKRMLEEHVDLVTISTLKCFVNCAQNMRVNLDWEMTESQNTKSVTDTDKPSVLLNQLYSLLSEIKDLSPREGHCPILEVAKRAACHLKASTDEEPHRILPHLEGWLAKHDLQKQQNGEQVITSSTDYPPTLRLDLDVLDGEYVLSDVRALPESDFRRYNWDLESFCDPSQPKRYSLNEINDFIDNVFRKVLRSTSKKSKIDWIILLNLPIDSSFTSLQLSDIGTEYKAVVIRNRNNENGIGLKDENILLGNNFAVIMECNENARLNKLLRSKYKHNKFKVISLDLSEINNIGSIEKAFSRHLNGYPLVVITNDIDYDTKINMYQNEVFDGDPSIGLSDFFSNVKHAYEDVNEELQDKEGLYMIWCEYELNSNAESI